MITKIYKDLEHTADVQIHAWGDTEEETFTQAVYALVGVMSSVEELRKFEDEDYTIMQTGSSLEDLLYRFLDEVLFLFSTPPYLTPVWVKDLTISPSTDGKPCALRAIIGGVRFNSEIHPCRTEVKAITKSNLLVTSKHAYVILDI